MAKNIELVGLGALNMDYLYRVERILLDGEAVISEPQSFPGGSAANTVYGLARLGIKTGFIGIVGGDDDGARMLGDLASAGVDTSHVKKAPAAKSGYTLCLSDGDGRRSIYVIPGANNLLDLDEKDLSYLKQAKMLHVSSFAGEKQFGMLLRLAESLDEEPLLSFSPGAIFGRRGLAALEPIIKRTHILFVNHDELKLLTGEDIIAGAQTCLRRGCRTVAVTLGKGMELGGRYISAYIKDTEQEYFIEPAAERQSRVEATGAGDAFAAGFIYGWLRSKGLQVCGELGQIVAGFKLSRAGARAGLPTAGELTRRYRELYGKDI